MQRPDLVLAGLVVMATIAAVAVAGSVLMKHWAEFSRLQRIRIILGISVYLGFVNWILGHVVMFEHLLGGDAFRGTIVGEQHFLGRGGGDLTPVSKELFWFNYWYMLASAVIPAGSALLFIFVWILEVRVCRQSWARRIDDLRRRDDQDSLLELLRLLDVNESDYGVPGMRERELLGSILAAKTERADAELRPPYSPMAPVSVRSEQKELWIEFVKAHWGEIFPEGNGNVGEEGSTRSAT
jgi:hypothetical protein